MAGSEPYPRGNPRWLLAELTYACPLQCPYCSNPIDYAAHSQELTTEEWRRVFSEARAMGAVQLGLSGGEPLTRKDLPELVAHARELGYYSNLITSGVGLTEEKIAGLKAAGLDHIQISIQAPEKTLNNYLAGTDSFEQKKAVAHLKAKGPRSVRSCALLDKPSRRQVPFEADFVGFKIEDAFVVGYGLDYDGRHRELPHIAKVTFRGT